MHAHKDCAPLHIFIICLHTLHFAWRIFIRCNKRGSLEHCDERLFLCVHITDIKVNIGVDVATVAQYILPADIAVNGLDEAHYASAIKGSYFLALIRQTLSDEKNVVNHIWKTKP